MSHESIIILIAAASGVLALAAWVTLIAVPAWQSYSRVWERAAAVFMSLYSVAGFMLLGVGTGALVIWFWDRLTL